MDTLVIMSIVFLSLLVVGVLGWLPGHIARNRGHAHPAAVEVLSWGGLLLTGGLLWIVALAWAFGNSRTSRS